MRKKINIQIKKTHPDAIIPQYLTPGACGADLYSTSDFVIHPGSTILLDVGFAIALPEAYEGQIRPRSGMAMKHGITVLNSPGTVDSDYRESVGVLLTNLSRNTFHGTKGMRIAQLVINPVTIGNFIEVTDLSTTDRTGGFGSTGE